MISDIVKHTSKQARPISWLCVKLVCSERELMASIKKGQKAGYNVRIVDGHVLAKTAVGPTKDASVVPYSALGRKLDHGRCRVGQLTDWHAGSKHSDAAAFNRTAQAMWDSGVRVICVTGDILDGIGPKLMMDQTAVGFDGQADIALRMVSDAPKFKWLAIDGNHDGYHSNAIGMSSGRVLAQRMTEAGFDWTFLGTCLGSATIYDARFQLWHPHGGAGTANALRRILNARAESEFRASPSGRAPNVIMSGHFHKYAPLLVSPEPVLGICGPTFQRKGSEFANRISNGWSIGGAIASFNRYADGTVGEFSAEFVNADVLDGKKAA